MYERPLAPAQAEFATHVPLRLKSMVGQEAEVHVLYKGHLNCQKLEQNGVRCHRLEYPGLPWWLGLALAVRKVGKRERIQIFSGVWAYYRVLPIVLGARWSGARVIARVPGDPLNLPPVPRPGSRRWFKRSAGRLLERVSLKSVDCIQFVSNSLKEALSHRYSGGWTYKAIVLSQGVDLDKFFLRPLPAAPLRKVLFIGRQSDAKGLSDLLMAFEQVLPACPDAELTAIWNGTMPQTIPAKQVGRVRVRGEVPHEEVPAILREADVLVLPSYLEGLPNVVLEAMASGVLVIATAVGEVPALLADGRGVLVPPGDVDSLTVALQGVLSDSPSVAETVGKAYAYVQEHHGFESLRSQYLGLWKGLLKA